MSKMNAFNNTDSDKLYRKFVVKNSITSAAFYIFQSGKISANVFSCSFNEWIEDMKWKRCARRSFSPVQHALQTCLLFLLNTIVLKTHQGTFLFFYEIDLSC